MERKATAIWQGSLKEGKGILSTESGALKQTPYSYVSRFEHGKETNPEELLAAAHAGCFAMALSSELGKVGLVPTRLETTATITIDKGTITKSHLKLTADIPGDKGKIDAAVKAAKEGCPVSKLYKAEITLEIV